MYKANCEMKRSKIYMTLSGDVKKRYDDKIIQCGGIDPYTLPNKELSVDPKDFPDLTVLDIGNYMIQSVSPYTKRSFNAYKSTEAYSFFESGFVLSVGSKRTKDSAILVGRVKHSQRMNETPLKPWVIVNMNGKIHCGHCDCLAGLSETCSHVAAVCFAVSNIGECRDIKSVTDMLCKWNIPSFKGVSMSSAKEIRWRCQPHDRNTHESNFLKYCESITPLSDDQIDEFIKKCHSHGDITALGTIIMASEMRRKTNIKDEIFLASLYNVDHRTKNRLELIEIGKSFFLTVSDDEVKEISKITLNKEKSKFYLGLRRGRISGSNFKNCCTTSIENPSITTINCVMNPRKLDNIPSITYQIKNKKKAVDQYSMRAMSEHENFVYIQCGLIVNPRLPYFVGSPDGFVTCSCHGNGCFEIKCLKILESGGSFEVLTVKPNNILNRTENIYVLERSHELFYQVQLQMNLTSSNYCDVVIWSPNDFLIVKVEPDVVFWQEAIKKASVFHEQVIMPEILGKFYTKHNDTQTQLQHEKEELIELEIEILSPNDEQKIVGLEIDVLCSDEGIKTHEDSFEMHDLLSETPNKPKIRNESCELESKKNNVHFQYFDSYAELGVRNLMDLSVEDIVQTFSEHEGELKRLYDEHIQQPKKNYRSKDLIDFIDLYIVTEKQLQAMANSAETKLFYNRNEDQRLSDIIFDSILPEWALAAFCKKFNLTRREAVIEIQMQSESLIKINEH